MSTEYTLFSVCADRNLSDSARNKIAKSLIKFGADLHEQDKNGVTPLHFAVRFRRPDLVRMFLAAGADVNRTCKRSGSTPLHRAVTNTGAPGTAGKADEMLEIVNVLLENGADKSIKNKSGKRAVDSAKDAAILAVLKGRVAK